MRVGRGTQGEGGGQASGDFKSLYDQLAMLTPEVRNKVIHQLMQHHGRQPEVRLGCCFPRNPMNPLALPFRPPLQFFFLELWEGAGWILWADWFWQEKKRQELDSTWLMARLARRPLRLADREQQGGEDTGEREDGSGRDGDEEEEDEEGDGAEDMSESQRMAAYNQALIYQQQQAHHQHYQQQYMMAQQQYMMAYAALQQAKQNNAPVEEQQRAQQVPCARARPRLHTLTAVIPSPAAGLRRP